MSEASREGDLIVPRITVTREIARRVFGGFGVIFTLSRRRIDDILDAVGGEEIYEGLMMGSESAPIESLRGLEALSKDDAYELGVLTGVLASVGAVRSPEGLSTIGFTDMLLTVREVLLDSKNDTNTAKKRLQELIGGDTSELDALMVEWREFVERFPGLYAEMSPEPYLAGEWIGMFVGATIANNPSFNDW